MSTTASGQLVRLLHAAGTAESHVEARLASVGLSLAKLTALERLVDAGGSLPLGQLAERLACVKSNVTQLVDRLEADGFVARAADPGDRRSRLAVITEAGRAAFERGRAAKDAGERELFDRLTPAELEQLTTIARKLANAQD